MRASQMLFPTVKEDPAGAEAVSHKLMVRAGLVRQLAAGIYVYLPAGWRVMRKIEQIIREELDAIGCQELLMPVLQPAEIWQESRSLERHRRRDVPPQGPQGHRHGAGHDARRGRHLAGRARGPQLQAAPAALVPLPDQGARRGAPQERSAAHARVHHEGFVQPRRQRRGSPGELPRAHRRLRPHLRPLRPRVHDGRGRLGHDGRGRQPRVHGLRRRRRGRDRLLP